jgi:hypothetical protein
MFKRSIVLSFGFSALVACSGGTGASTNVGSTSDALRGTVTHVDTAAHRLSLHTSKGEVEAEWQSPELRHGDFSKLTVSKEIELHGHVNEKAEFEVEAIELEPGDDKGTGTEPGDDKGGTQPGDDKGGTADAGHGADDDAATAPPGTPPPADDHGGKGKP